jgi:hypothetical protein
VSGKSGKRVTGRKPVTSTRTSAKPDGAFGRENINQIASEPELNVDKAITKRLKAGK